MKPGDLVEFKEGLFGLNPPKNHGIYLERVKRKKNYFVVLHTLKGRKEVKPDNVSGKRLAARLDPDLTEGNMTQRLRDLIGKVSDGEIKEVTQPGEEDIRDRALWEKAADLGEATPEDLAGRFYDTPNPTRRQIAAIREALKACQRPGVGYFERLPGREERWAVLSREDYRAVKTEIDALNALKNKLVRVEELPPEDEWSRPKKVYHGVPLDEAGLDDADRERLEWLGGYMASFVLHDRDTGEHGLAGTPVHTIDGFSVFQLARWLAIDWTGAEGTISGAFAQFLLDTGLWSPDGAIRTIAKRKVGAHDNFAWEVPAEAVREAEKFPEEFPPEWLEGRADLRHLDAWTIDPPDAKDFDDAISFQAHDDGGCTLWVHIADVAHYVAQGTICDHHARKRATSVYLPVGVLPMLPPRLSDNLCSLRDDADRLAMTAEMRFDAEGDVVEARFHESVIRVNENKRYPEIDEAVENGEEPFASIEAFARKLRSRRMGLALETDERKIHLSEDGVDVELKSASPATRMIEQFMVAANEAVARHLTDAGLPILYRCHPLPERTAVDKFNRQMETMELDIDIELPEPEDAEDEGEEGGMSLMDQLKAGGKMELVGGGAVFSGLEEEEDEEEDAEEAAGAAEPHLKGLAQLSEEERREWLQPFRDALAKVEEQLDGRRRELVYIKALSAMGRALYTPRNLGHYGLGSACYGHFTSPIRRYPDLVVHRQLKWLLRGGEESGEEMPHDLDELDDLAEHTTEQAIGAEGLEWATVDAAMALMARRGEWSGTQHGIVNGVGKGGVFVSLPGHLEARLPSSEVSGGPWSVDDAESMLFKSSLEHPNLEEEVTAENWRELVDEDTGEVKRVRYRLGDDAYVRISDVDVVEGKVAVKEAPRPSGAA